MARNDYPVKAWIDDYQRINGKRADCIQCGWPHHASLLCGSGSTFGQVVLGNATYYVDACNVEFMVDFVMKLGSGFHWKQQVFFEVKDEQVVISRVEPYNNCPHVKSWTLTLREWQSITDFVKSKAPSPGVTSEQAEKRMMLEPNHAEAHEWSPDCRGAGCVEVPAVEPARDYDFQGNPPNLPARPELYKDLSQGRAGRSSTRRCETFSKTWQAASESREQAMRECLSKLLESDGHVAGCAFSGCTCGGTERYRVARAEACRILR